MLQNLVNKFVAKGLTDVGRCPQEPYGTTLFEDAGSTWADATPRGNKDNATEERRDAKDAVAWDATDPKLLWRVHDLVVCPIPGLRDNERVAFLVGGRNAREAVPFQPR